MFNIRKIKMPLRFVFAAVLLMLMLLPSSAFAKMVGPYTGQVFDSRTGEPIQGASVYIYWVKLIPALPEGYSELIKITLVYTDDQGMYRIPQQFLNIGLIGWLESTKLIIYQPGYQAYIKNRWWDKAPTFPHKENNVKLEIIPSGFDHRKHHKRITDAMRGLDIDYYEGVDHMTGRPLLLSEIVKRHAIMAEYWEFMRRIEWEEDREGIK